MPTVKSLLPLLAAVGFASPALAQTDESLPLTADNGHLILTALGQELAFPMPDWIGSADADWSADASSHFSELGAQANLEIYPRGDGAAFWSRIYGAKVTALTDPVLTDFRAVVMDVYAGSCQPDNMAFFQLEADQGDDLPPLGFVCGTYANGQLEGEVTILGFYKSDGGVAMLYRGWRGAAFDVTQPASWPVGPSELETQIAGFKTEVSFGPAD